MPWIRSFLLAGLGYAAAIGSGWAQVQGTYAGLGAGLTEWNAATDSFDDGTLTSGTPDGSDRGWKLLLGYRFSKYFGVEAGYADLGQVTFVGNSTGCLDPDDCFYAAGPVAIERRADGFSGQALGLWPWKRIDVYGKLGFCALDLDVEAADPASRSPSLTSTETVWGAGLQYRFGRPIVRLEWERFTNVPDDSVDFYSATFLYRFGGR